MKKQFWKAPIALVASAFALLTTGAHAAGFQHGHAPDREGKPLEIGIWYPSRTPPAPLALGPTTQTVAVNAPIDGTALPLVVMSHGTGGSYLGHVDTAIALADAGFVVAAVTHTGDNYADQSRSVFVMDRPRQMSRVIDHLLTGWSGHAAIDPARIGIFGFSAGGFTALVSIGGVADFTTVAPMCRAHPTDFACGVLAASPAASAAAAALPASGAASDGRIKAAVVAAPALGFAFAPSGLAAVKVPVQLWRAEDDTVLPHPRYAEAVRLALPTPPDYRVVPQAGHFDFLAPCSPMLAGIAPAICASAPGFDRAAFHAAFNVAVVAFFNKTLTERASIAAGATK